MQSESHSARLWIVPILVGIAAFVVLLLPLLVATWLVPPTERMVTVFDLRNRTGTIDTTYLERVLAAGGSGPSTLLVLVSPGDDDGVPACTRPEESLCRLRQAYPQAVFVASNFNPNQLLLASGADPNGISYSRSVFHAMVRESTGGRTLVIVIVAAVMAACCAAFSHARFRRGGGRPIFRRGSVRTRSSTGSWARHDAPRTAETAPPPRQSPARVLAGGANVFDPDRPRSPVAEHSGPPRTTPPGTAEPRAAAPGVSARGESLRPGQPRSTASDGPTQAPMVRTDSYAPRDRSLDDRDGGPPRTTRPGTAEPRAAAPGGVSVHEQPLQPNQPRSTTIDGPTPAPPVRPGSSAPRACTFVDIDGGYVEHDNIVRWAVLAKTETTPIEPEEPVAVVGGTGEPMLIVRADPRHPLVTTCAGRKS